MGPTAIFWPMMAQVFLTYAIYIVVSSRRMASVKEGKAKADDFRIPVTDPAASATAARNLSNQFELPVLFFAACLSLFVTGGAGPVAVLVAWGFVLARVAHSLIHVTSNRLRYRRPAFVVGFVLNLLLWGLLALNLAGVA